MAGVAGAVAGEAAALVVNVPVDVATEYLGRATGKGDVLTVANAPLYWGRQTVWERSAIQAGAPLSAPAKSLARASDCESCHGKGSTSWKAPAERVHPAARSMPTQSWSIACGSCHDSDAATAHLRSQVFMGNETCAVCHGPGRAEAVDKVHRLR